MGKTRWSGGKAERSVKLIPYGVLASSQQSNTVQQYDEELRRRARCSCTQQARTLSHANRLFAARRQPSFSNDKSRIPMDEEMKAVAKAAEEIAKATGKSVDAVSKFGSFISEYTRAPLQAGFGILADRLNYMRWERQQRLILRAGQFLEQAGLTEPSRAVPLNFAVPLLEAASLEEDDNLQDLWAILLVNAANARSTADRRRAYISILEQLTALDALVLSKIYALPRSCHEERAAITSDLPDVVRLSQEDDVLESLAQPSQEILLSLANLVRIGCLDSEENWAGMKDYRHAYRTVLGKAFMEAVTLQRL